MDCNSTLEILDCVRPNSDDLLLPEMAEARTHLESCSTCQSEFAERQQFDLRISKAIVAVALPNGLEDRVRKAVSAVAQSQPQSIDGSESEPSLETRRTVADLSAKRRSLRRWGKSAVAVALLLMGVWMWVPPSGPTFSVAQILTQIPTDVPAASPFDGAFDLPLPTDWSNASLRYLSDWRGQNLDERPDHDVALRVFRFTSRRGATVDGLIAVMPANRVSPAPTSTVFSATTPSYPARDDQKFVAVAWQEADVVFFCLVPDSVGDLELLQRSLRRASA